MIEFIATKETHKIISIDREASKKKSTGPVEPIIVSCSELIVLLYVSKEQREQQEETQKKQAAVESFISGKYEYYEDGKVKYYHTDAIKKSTDPKKPIRFTHCSLLISRIVTVRAFDAHHCPGSCMFLFEMFEGSDDHFESFFSMLYTGDFCYNNIMKDYCKSINSIIPSLTLLHVDDTACLLNKNSFTGIPYSREDAINTIHYLINKMKKGKVQNIHLFQL